jgi:hypothetical protein
VLAPVLLLLAAACSIAAVFAVHRIESSGGPLAEPSASTYFSPNDDGVQDVAEIRFTTQRPERVTLIVVDERGRAVRTLLDDERIDGPHEVEWDGADDAGRTVDEGEYRMRISRAGDGRIYAPTRPTVVDVTPPEGRLDRATWELGELRGLALLEPVAKLEALDRYGFVLEGMRAFRPRPGARSALPEGPKPDGTVAVRFTVPLESGTVPFDEVRLDAVDKAGNRTALLGVDGAPSIEVLD